MRNRSGLSALLLAAALGGCASLRPAPQRGIGLVETAPGCRAQHSLMDLRYDLYGLAGGTMVAAPGAACPMPLDQFIGFARALFVVSGARITVPPTHGTATVVGNGPGHVEVIYRSAPDFTGYDGFTVNVLPTNLPVPVSVTVAPFLPARRSAQ